jgi:hypothetical protein
MTSVTELQHRIQKTRRYLHRLETELDRAKYVTARKQTEEEKIARLEREFRKKYPRLEIDRSVLRLVGTEPYNPPSEDKAVNRRITAERYG